MFPEEANFANVDPILYGDFRTAASLLDDVHIYEDLRDYDTVKPILEGK
jgi:hypothetical protein